jgi:hypothetical protein
MGNESVIPPCVIARQDRAIQTMTLKEKTKKVIARRRSGAVAISVPLICEWMLHE